MAGYIRVQIAPEYIEETLRTGGTHRGVKCVEGLPADAVLVGADLSPASPGGQPTVFLHFRTTIGQTGDKRPLFQVNECPHCGGMAT